MNFPYSTKKWVTISMAALMITSASAAFADTSKPATGGSAPASTPATTAAPAAKQAEAADENILTLEKAITQALATNSSLQSLRLDVKTADLNQRLTTMAVRDIPADSIESVDQATAKYAREAEAQMAETLNALALKGAENKIKLGAQQIYYDLLHAKAEVELKKQSLNRAQTQLKVAKAAFEVGTRAKTDVLQAEMGVAGAQAALASAENNLKISQMKVNEFLGVDLMKQWELKEENKQMNAIKLTLAEATEQAIKQRVETTQKQEQLKLAEIKVSIVEKYSSLATYQGKVARNNVEKAKLAIEDQKRTISLEVAQAFYTLNAAQLNVEFNKKAKESAAENYRLTNLRFENGLATTLDVITAEEELSDKENQYQKAVRDYNLAVVNFETALEQ